jgi:hypothetical protein
VSGGLLEKARGVSMGREGWRDTRNRCTQDETSGTIS